MSDRFTNLVGKFDRDKFLTLNEEMSFSDYVDRLYANPRLIRTAYQRMYDMIMAGGTSEFEKYRHTFTHYHFFDDPEIPIFGLQGETINPLVKFIRGAAGGYGTEKRILLLHGPVGSSKSTICRLLKRGLEDYSKTEEGAWYTFKWVDLPIGQNGISITETDDCPMNDEPLKLLSRQMQQELLANLNKELVDKTPKEDRMGLYDLRLVGTLNPRCKKYLKELMKLNGGDLGKVLNNHVRVVRKVHSEADRVGIATFQPKDEKNQDSTELTGDLNWSKIAHFGSDSDPRAFNFDGEFCVASRGMCEFIEMLKLQREFLYDLLGASQEQQIKPKKFPQIGIDTVLIGHTNNPELVKLQQDQYMEALRDRTVKVDVPYLLEWSKEIKIYEHDYGPNRVKQHIAPHTLEIAALYAVLTRLKNDDQINDPVKKAKLYDGKALPGWNEDRVKEARERFIDEGMATAISARQIQDALSICLSDNYEYVNPFMLLNRLQESLKHSSMYSDKERLKRYVECIDAAMKELDVILKDEVQKALVSDEEAIVRLCSNYSDNVMAYMHKSKVKNQYTGRDEEPNEALMRGIEEKIEIPNDGADDFRMTIAGRMADLANKEQKFHWDSDAQLKEALQAKLFEDTKDHIKLSTLNVSGATVVDPDLQEKIDVIRQRLIDKFGYNEQSARDVLDHVGSIFARGNLAGEEG
jgi:serine protein kinase